MRKLERKHGPSTGHFLAATEFKFAASGDEMTFAGYGAVFGNVDAYGDVIVKGAFRDSINSAKKNGLWPAMLLQHGGFTSEDMMPVGVWTEMKEDETGLYIEGKMADTARGREAYALMKMQPRPAITGLSIGYIAKEFRVGTKPDEPRRTLKSVELVEISLVTFPANPKARVGDIKSEPTIRDAEQALRDAGFSRAQAKAIVADGFKTMPQRDAGDVGLAGLAELLRHNITNMSKG